MDDKLKAAAAALAEAHKAAVHVAHEDLEFRRFSMGAGPEEATGWQHAAATMESLADATVCLVRLLDIAGATHEAADLKEWSAYRAYEAGAWSRSAEDHAVQIVQSEKEFYADEDGGADIPDSEHFAHPDIAIMREAAMAHGRAASAYQRAMRP